MNLDLSDALKAAPSLLGYLLVHDSPEGRTAGYIVETEAYMDHDAASHTFRGEGKRNKVMFGPPGCLYVYFTYGMHYCVNVVTGPQGNGQGILIRALQPVEGIKIMQQRRKKLIPTELTNGPGKLAQAMGINKEHNGLTLLSSGALRLEPGILPEQITQTPRIGISRAKDKPWRFYVSNNPHVSKR